MKIRMVDMVTHSKEQKDTMLLALCSPRTGD